MNEVRGRAIVAIVSARDISSLEANGGMSRQTPGQITDLLVQLVACRYEWNLSQYLSNSSSHGAQKWLLASSRLQNTFLRLDFFFFVFQEVIFNQSNRVW